MQEGESGMEAPKLSDFLQTGWIVSYETRESSGFSEGWSAVFNTFREASDEATFLTAEGYQNTEVYYLNLRMVMK
jgi:hypothetical protein